VSFRASRAGGDEKKRDPSIVPVAHDNMAIYLMAYILTSLIKDFK